MESRIDTQSILIKASPATIYKTLITPSLIKKWKAPKGMHMEIFHVNVRAGGTYRMALSYDNHSIKGKSGNNSDLLKGRFVELVPDQKVVEAVCFDSNDPSFAGEMIMTMALEPEKGGTRVTFTATQVPEGITPEDHAAGMQSSLQNLAALVE